MTTENCQDRVVEIEQSSDVWLYNLVTKAAVEMVTLVDETPTYAVDNVNGFMSSILAWVRGADAIIGERNFTGFQIYDADSLADIDDITSTCQTALSQVIKCDAFLQRFQQPSYHGTLGRVASEEP